MVINGDGQEGFQYLILALATLVAIGLDDAHRLTTERAGVGGVVEGGFLKHWRLNRVHTGAIVAMMDEWLVYRTAINTSPFIHTTIPFDFKTAITQSLP